MPVMVRTRIRSLAAIVFAYALALQGMLSPLAAAPGAPDIHADICYGLPGDGAAPAGGNPGGANGADHCNLACCASLPVASAPAAPSHAIPEFAAFAAGRPETPQAAVRAGERRTFFPRAPPAA